MRWRITYSGADETWWVCRTWSASDRAEATDIIGGIIGVDGQRHDHCLFTGIADADVLDVDLALLALAVGYEVRVERLDDQPCSSTV